jgi:serine/threonine protein kinase
MNFDIDSFRDARHIDKTHYLGPDRRFYEANYVHYIPKLELRNIVEEVISQHGSSWHFMRSNVWTHVMAAEDNLSATELLRQGWKIHVSATNLNCEQILRRIATLAVERTVQFKFANDTETLRLMTSKRWARGGSGKFITLYPSSIDEFCNFLEAADILLKDFSGSYILSDRRYNNNKCLYYRYGGMRSSTQLNVIGWPVEFLTSPQGERVPDKRRASFETPYWANDPFPVEEPDQYQDLTLNSGRFSIESVFSYSNTGGVYLAIDNETKEKVVIKEARPGVELSENGQDAVSRLAHEAVMLETASVTGVVPSLITTFWDWENFYLVEEYFEAEDMRGIMLLNSPLLKFNPSEADSEVFYTIYRTLFIKLLEAIEILHECGVIIGDLSPTNILFEKESGRLKIIDLEGAFRPSIDTPQDIHTPGFRADSENFNRNSDYSDDLYAIGVIMTYAMFPIGAMAFIRDDVFENVLPVMLKDLGWDGGPILETVRRLIANTISCSEAIANLKSATHVVSSGIDAETFDLTNQLDSVCDGLAQFISSNYRLEPIYSLFPIDPFGQLVNPLGLYFGATGVIHALRESGYTVPQPALDRYHSELNALDLAKVPPGLLTGKAGMAWGLLEAGNIDDGLRFLDSANSDELALSHHSLYYGMAGVGMANLAAYQATKSEQYRLAAEQLAEQLRSSAIVSDRGIHWGREGPVQLGFGYGQSGVALFFLRMSQISGDVRLLELGRNALEYDLSYGVELEPGAISFGEAPTRSETLLPYIEQGSGGIAKVAIRYGMWDKIDGLLNDNYRKYSAFSGLIYGTSGLIDVLLDAYIYSKNPIYLNMMRRPIQGLYDLHLFKSNDGYAAPGENMFRISLDYATGLSGILCTLNRQRHLKCDMFCLDALDSQKLELSA